MAPARILIVAGSDSGGGAGIQADLNTVTRLGGYGMTAITAVTVQNTLGVTAVHAVPVDIITAQMEAVITDIGVDAVKTGMLHSAEIIEAVAVTLHRLAPDVPLVVDPVMVAKGGASLLEKEAVSAMREALLPMAALVTPNIPEAEVLTGLSIPTAEAMHHAAAAIQAMGARAVLMKGGHLPGRDVADLLLTPNGEWRESGARINTPHTHGTGCTMASALATFLGQGLALPEAFSRARTYIRRAIEAAPGLGGGHGPLGSGA